ncbi:MAG: hypothetical protein IJ868_05315 [Prevotella sp.]|nr:hypothetical protein [Prevotella sp.]
MVQIDNKKMWELILSNHPNEQDWINICDIKLALADQGLKFEDGEIVEINSATEEEIPQKPKFKIGDWVANNSGCFFQITWVGEESPCYKFKDTFGNENMELQEEIDENCHIFTLQDAKDGDVLATFVGTFIYNGMDGGGECPGAYCGMNTKGEFQEVGSKTHWTSKEVFPATKEQRDALFAKMKEAGYEWNGEKKVLKKIEQTPIAWSKEDETRLTNIIIMLKEGASHHFIKDYITKAVDWLKSLRPQSKQDWSEEDEEYFNRVCTSIEWARAESHISEDECLNQETWLKSLRPQKQWNLKDKHIRALEYQIANTGDSWQRNATKEVLGFLKQLKGE